jgi:flagellar hook capping protein FlgD
VARDVNLTLLLLSPTTVNPQNNEITLLVDDAPQAFQYTPANNDPSGRQWLLSWTHHPYAAGRHVVKAAVTGSATSVHPFQVVPQVGIANLMNFPNPFDDELGTRFTFTLTGDEPADLRLRVFTVAGRLVYERTERSVSPGYCELPWDGRDAEGDRLGNGVYLYRVLAASPSGHASKEGRLVKLRRPHQVEETATK